MFIESSMHPACHKSFLIMIGWVIQNVIKSFVQSIHTEDSKEENKMYVNTDLCMNLTF